MKSDDLGARMRVSIRLVAVLIIAGGPAALPAAGEPGAGSQPARKVAVTVSAETTFLLGPLNADGTVNYVAAANELLGRGVTPENNAAVPLIQAIGPQMLPEAGRAEMLRRLGIAALPEEGEYFALFHDYLADGHAVPEGEPARGEVIAPAPVSDLARRDAAPRTVQ